MSDRLLLLCQMQTPADVHIPPMYRYKKVKRPYSEGGITLYRDLEFENSSLRIAFMAAPDAMLISPVRAVGASQGKWLNYQASGAAYRIAPMLSGHG